MALSQFVSARGSARVPARAVARGVPLGKWAAACREEYWEGELTVSQVAELESLPGWDWSGGAQKRWEAHFAVLSRYVDQHGAAMTLHSAVFEGVKVGEWARAQRAKFAAGTLPEPLAARLEALPGWIWTGVDERWDLGFRAVRAYLDKYGTANVPTDARIDGFPVGQWVARCREDQRAGSLSPGQTSALADLPGWRWSASADQWERGISALRAFVSQYGHASPQQKTTLDGFPVGMWVHHRRKQYRSGRLPPPRANELESLPGWSWGQSRKGKQATQ